jgi:hypothetical protein
LSAELKRRIAQHHLVVWQDSDGEYRTVAAEVMPEDAEFECWDGSWYALRKEVESRLSGGSPPKLVVYIPVPAADPDPLLELRAAANDFRLRVGTLVRQALGGELAAGRLAEIARDAKTLEEAEQAAAGSAAVDVRLASALGPGDPVGQLVKVLAGSHDAAIDTENAWPAVARLAERTVGGAYADLAAADLREALTRQLLLAELMDAGVQLPTNLVAMARGPSQAQVAGAVELLERWRTSTAAASSYAELALQAERDLDLERSLEWQDAMSSVGSTAGLERLAHRHACELLAADASGVGDLAAARLAAYWVRNEARDVRPSGTWRDRWVAVAAVAELLNATQSVTVPAAPTLDALLRWYADVGHRADRAHRRMELALTLLPTLEELEPLVVKARAAYESWLDGVLCGTSDAIGQHSFDTGALRHLKGVSGMLPLEGDSPVAYILVDALRYEMGLEVAEALRAAGYEVTCEPAVAPLPTITRVGMAAAAAGEHDDLSLDLGAGNRLSVNVGGTPIDSVAHRVELLRTHFGTTADFELSSVLRSGERELAKQIRGARLVLVRSQEVDAAGESGALAASWRTFEDVTDLLPRVIARLNVAGVRTVCVTADHGFIALTRSLRADRTTDPPRGGRGELHRRAWIGTGADVPEHSLRVPLAQAGIVSELEIVTPRGLAVFSASGGRQFFHGGISPQELTVAAVVATSPEAERGDTNVSVDIALDGGSIKTGVFRATVTFVAPDLFSSETFVRVVAERVGNRVVARPLSGAGLDQATGSVRLESAQPASLAFRVTANLRADDDVRLRVLDARTDRLLAETPAPVATNIVVEDEL